MFKFLAFTGLIFASLLVFAGKPVLNLYVLGAKKPVILSIRDTSKTVHAVHVALTSKDLKCKALKKKLHGLGYTMTAKSTLYLAVDNKIHTLKPCHKSHRS